MPQLRKDPIVDRWVIIATERGVRPKRDRTQAKRLLEDANGPFCPGNEDATAGEILAFRPDGSAPNTSGWTLRVVPNKYPALKVEGELGKRGEGLYDMMNGVGAHEVIIETPRHDLQLSDLPARDIEDILWAYRDRLLDLKNDSRLRYGVIFKNHGAQAGATIGHSHSQLIALPIIPKLVAEEMAGAQRYYDFRDRCVYCDIVEQETRDGSRVIHETEHVVALAPFASRSPFEVMILPREHHCSFVDSPAAVFRETAAVMRLVLRKLKKALDDPPYNYMLHTSPFGESALNHYHWHIEIIPKLTDVAGFEWGSGFYINPTPPEHAAKFLREIEVEL